MNSKKISKSARVIFASLGMLLSFSSLAESPVESYKYGLKLDVAKVLSISTEGNPNSHVCRSVDRVMKYIDSTGKTKAVKYKAFSDGCSKGR